MRSVRIGMTPSQKRPALVRRSAACACADRATLDEAARRLFEGDAVHLIGPEEYDKQVDDGYWWSRWECEDNPCAKAYWLLSKIDVRPKRRSARGPVLEFHDDDNYPGSNDRWSTRTTGLTCP